MTSIGEKVIMEKIEHYRMNLTYESKNKMWQYTNQVRLDLLLDLLLEIRKREHHG